MDKGEVEKVENVKNVKELAKEMFEACDADDRLRFNEAWRKLRDVVEE